VSVHSGFEPRRVLIVGAGTLGRTVADILLTGGANARLVAVGYVDSDSARTGEMILGLPVFGTLDQLPAIPHDGLVVAVSDNTARGQVTRDLQAAKAHLVSVRHPFSSIAHDVHIGSGTVVSAGAVVGPGARIGSGVVLGMNVCIEAGATIGDFASLSAGVVVASGARISDHALIERNGR
jgi:acetyltransferase EpsM